MTSHAITVGAPLTEGKWAGWTRWIDPQPETFLKVIGQTYMRPTGPSRALVALETQLSHRNRMDALHGGMVAAFADHAFFGALWAMGHQNQLRGVTIDLSMQYLSTGRIGPDLVADTEILRETGRLFFMRMLISQEGEAIAASTATIRKVTAAR